MIVFALASVLFLLLVGVGVTKQELSTREAFSYVAFWVVGILVHKHGNLGFYKDLWHSALAGSTLIMDKYLLMRILKWEPIVPQWNGRFPWR